MKDKINSKCLGYEASITSLTEKFYKETGLVPKIEIAATFLGYIISYNYSFITKEKESD